MLFNYTPLWKQLKNAGLSKTDLRLKTGISTSTLAKLSAGEAVSLEVLQRIAMVLRCTLNDIISTGSTNSTTQWSTIKPNLSYTIRIVLLINEDQAYYITGSATSFKMPFDGIDTWYISKYSDLKNYYLLEGCADSERLTQLLTITNEAYTLGYFFDTQKIKLNSGKISKNICNSIKNVMLCNGYAQYHSPYIMPTENYCKSFKPELTPIASPTDGIRLCEGFENPLKRILYTDNDSVIESRKKELLSIIRNEFANTQGLSDIIHLGNFEILTNPSGTYDESAGINTKIEKDVDSHGKLLNFIISLAHEKIEKTVTLEFIAYSETNPISDIIAEFDCRTEDKTWIHSVWLPCDGFEIKMWHSDNLAEQSGELLYHIKHSLITDISLTMQIVEKEYNLVDEWTKMVNKAGKVEELKPVQTTNLKTKISQSSKSINTIIKADFRSLLASNPLPGQSIFLEKGENKQIEFLEWLKSAINTPDISNVILIDPYIDLKSIGACLRSAGNYNQEWEIYMDIKKKMPDTIEKMKNVLALASPLMFHIYGVSDKLHDRFLILLGTRKRQVYMLSNSLDTVAMNYPSAIVLIDDIVSEQIIKYYGNMLGTVDKKTIFSSADCFSSSQDDNSSIKAETVIIPESYIKGNITTVKDAESVLKYFFNEGIVKLYPHRQMECISAYRCLCNKEIINDKLLTSAENFIISSVNYTPYIWKAEKIYDAVCFLRENNLNSLINITNDIASTDYGSKIPPMTYCYISMLLLYSIADTSYNLDINNIDGNLWLNSEVSFIRAMFIVALIEKANVSTLSQIIDILPRYVRNENERVSSFIFLLKKILRTKKYPTNAVNSISQQIASCLKKMRKLTEADISEYFKNTLLPLYPWYAEAISRITYDAFKSSAINKEKIQQIMIYYLMKCYKEGMVDENSYLTFSDLLQSCNYIDGIMHINPNAATIVSAAMKKIERSTDQLLYNPTLKLHNYAEWKKNIDLLGSMVYLEIYLHKKYGAKLNSISINEYLKICTNYENDLKKYSEIYLAVSEIIKGIQL